MLVGAGRANLGLLRAFRHPLLRGVEIVLVSSEHEQFDSAMRASLLRGSTPMADARIDATALAERAGARMVGSRAERLDLDHRVVIANGERIAFDVCVLDEVGLPLGADVPGVTRYTLPLRPMSVLPEVRGELDRRLGEAEQHVRCTIVGGGMAGVECAFFMVQRLRELGRDGVVTIVDAAPRILEDHGPCRDVAHSALRRLGVCFVLGARVVEVRSDALVLDSGATLPGEVVIWATGGAPPPLIVASGLPHDTTGRLVVDERLRSRDGAPVWAAGDCATRGAGDQYGPEAQAAILERELGAQLGAPRHGTYSRPRSAACFVDTGDGQAIMRWGTLTMRSRLAAWLQRRRDRRALARLTAGEGSRQPTATGV